MSIDVNAIEQTVVVTAVGDEVNVNIIDQPVLVSVTDQIIEVEASGGTGPQGPAGAGVAAGGTTGQVLSKASNTNYDTVWVDAGAGTVYSVDASGSTGISVTGGPITGAGTLTITNTAPDQVVALSGAGTAVITGTYPNFTITTNDEFDGTVTSVNLTAGTGISVSGGPITGSGSISVTNTAPDQVVSLTGGGTTTISGTYPNFTISSTDSKVGTVTSVDMTVPTGLTISGNPITSAGTLALALASGYSIPTTASQATWDAAYNDKINSAAVTGTTTKTLTLNQQDGGTITASWTDDNTDAVTSVFGRTGAVVATVGDYTTSQVTEGTNLYYTEGRVSANTDVAANTAARHNAVTLGTANGLSLSTQALSLGLASGSTTGALSSTDWSTFNGKQNAITLTTTGSSGASTFVSNTLNVPTYTLTGLGGVPSTRSITINGTAFDLSADRSYSVGTVTSVTLATGTTGTDVNVSNGTITSSGTITLNIPDASATARGLITTGIQTIAGAKTFSSSLTVPSLYLSNMTAGSGALYYNTAENRLTLANYNASGILMFEVNGGAYAMQLNADLTARLNGYTTNGFVKFGSSNGTLVVDTTTYTPTTRSISTTSPLVGGGDLSADRTLSIPAATTSVNGYLTSTDWTTFNGKQNAITLTTTGTSGAATLVGATLNIPQYADQFVGTVTSVSALTIGTTGTDLSSTVANGTTTPVITLNVPTASATNRGALSSADWTTFNGKQAQLNGTGFVKISGTTISYDNSTYYLASNPSSYIALTALTASSPLLYNNTTGVFSIQLGTDSQNGYLSSSDRTTFNNKQDQFTVSSPLSFSGLNITISQASGSVSGFLSSTDWTTFNNKQNTITNPVTGTGTTNYLPKWTSGSAIGNSVIQESSSLIGVNVTPTRVLHLSSSGSNSAIRLDNTVSGRPFLLLYDDSQNLTFINSSDSGYTAFNSGTGASTTKMLLTNGGNLLVGTTTDSGDKLQVNGNVYSTGRTTSFGYRLPDWQIYNTSGGSLAFNNYTSDFLTIANSGAATFSSSVTAGGVVKSRTANYPQIVFEESTTNTDSLIFYDNVASTKQLGFRVNSGTNVMSLTSTNVLIGTTTDSGEKLQVSGSVKITNILTQEYGNAYQIKSGATEKYYYSNGASYNAFSTGIMGIGTTADPIGFATTNAIRMTIKSDGIINLSNVPSSATGLSAGDIYKDASGFLKIV